MSENSTTDHRYYKLGNCLRGGFEGLFPTTESAWVILSERFYMSFPSETGRSVEFYVREPNVYGLYQYVLAKQEKATKEKSGLTESQVMNCCSGLLSDRLF